MQYLLDTHLLLWWLSGSDRLTAAACGYLTEPDNVICVSAVNHWEIAVKLSLGKLVMPSDFHQRLDLEGFEDLPFKAAHAKEVAHLPWHHRDPFDRALVAQARVEGFVLLTADATLSAYGPCVRVV